MHRQLTCLLLFAYIIQRFIHGSYAVDPTGGEADLDINEMESLRALLPFVRSMLDQLRDDPRVMRKLIFAIDSLASQFPVEQNPNSFLPVALRILKEFLTLGRFVSPTTAIDVTRTALSHYSKPPDSVANNLSKLSNVAMYNAGGVVGGLGKMTSGAIRTLKDLHATSVPMTNTLTGFIPGLGYLTSSFNAFTGAALETAHLANKFGSKQFSNRLMDAANLRNSGIKRRRYYDNLMETDDDFDG